MMWIFTGVMAIIIGTSIVDPMKDMEEGVFLSSIISLNSFLTYLAHYQVRQSIITISSRYSLLGLMMNTQVLLMFTTTLFMLGIRVCSALFQKIIDEGLFKKRPPDLTFNIKYKVKIRKQRSRSMLMSAVTALVCLPTFIFAGRESLTQDLHAYVGKIEYLQTGHLPAELRNRVRHDLTQHP